MRNKVILAVTVTVILIGIIWANNHSFISITAPEAATENLTSYTLLHQDGSKATGTSSGGQYRKLVKKGNYQITVKQDDQTFITTAAAGGFLGTTEITANLSPEAGREFVGDNPGPCMNYVGRHLVSGECDSELQNLKYHRHATADNPSYAETIPGNNYAGALQGSAWTDAGLVVFSKVEYLQHEEEGADYFVQVLSDGPAISFPTLLDGLKPDDRYSIKAYRDGFIIYNQSFGQVLYYSAVGAKPEPIKLERPSDNNLQPLFLTATKDAILTAYSPAGSLDHDDEELENHGSQKGRTDIFVQQAPGQAQSYTLDWIYHGGVFCGTNKVCLISNQTLDIYDVSSNKALLLSSIYGVTDYRSAGDGFLAATEDGIIRYDTSRGAGFFEYSFGEYQFCGMQLTATGYLVCLINLDANRATLHITPGSKNSDSIDKKVLSLQKVSAISHVSVLGQYIYIVPEYGTNAYNEETDGFGPTRQKRKKTNDEVIQAITKSGIPTSTYKIINTGAIEF